MALRETLGLNRRTAAQRGPVLGPGPSPFWLFFSAVAVLVAAVMVYGLPGHSYAVLYLHDSFVTFDGIHRIAAGQVPHLDFSTPLGALGYVLPYLGWLYTGGYGGAIEAGSVLLAALVVPWTALLLARRVSTLTAIAVLVAVCATIVVPRGLDADGNLVSPAMYYNRWGWAVLVALSVALVEPYAPWRFGAVLVGVFAGVMAAILLFLKATFFAAGLGILGLMLIQSGQRRWAALWALAVLAGALGAVNATYPGALEAYLADLRMAAEASLHRWPDWHFIVADNLGALVLAGVGFALAASVAILGVRDWLVLAVLLVAAVLLPLQNDQRVGLMLVLSVLMVADRLSAEYSDAGEAPRLGILGLSLVFLSPMALDWVKASLRYTAAPSAEAVVALDLPGMEKIYIPEEALLDAPEAAEPQMLETGSAYAASVADGLALLERNAVVDKTLLTLDFLNPFPMLLDLPRRSGGYQWMHPGRMMSQTARLPADEVFAGVDFVLEPLHTVLPSGLEVLQQAYGGDIAERYSEIDRSEYWVLYGPLTDPVEDAGAEGNSDS